MDGKYPIKPFKDKPVLENRGSTSVLEGKGGKIIETNYNTDNWEFVTFTVKSNRGNVKDTIEIPVERVLSFARHIITLNELWVKKEV